MISVSASLKNTRVSREKVPSIIYSKKIVTRDKNRIVYRWIINESRKSFRVVSCNLNRGNEIEQEKQVNQDSLKQKADTMAKVDESEEKYKVLEEKFEKLKDVYGK
ncbi:uncharacterized protein LOC122401894 [Colletes gigas]|uniref:uncharacterized protein LOC122401894 n=1 Tax=Colletes gigas TaxID=935657 RepID=UPI001C9B2F79|nr:uncharacterized protein LOC122401894 [Colletes gigas]